MFYLFGTAILIGATMAYLRMKGQHYPAWSLTILHALFAVTGLLWMFVIALSHTNRTSNVTGSLIVFCVVAVLGVIMLVGYHAQKRPLPIAVMIIHGILALAAFIWLLA